MHQDFSDLQMPFHHESNPRTPLYDSFPFITDPIKQVNINTSGPSNHNITSTPLKVNSPPNLSSHILIQEILFPNTTSLNKNSYPHLTLEEQPPERNFKPPQPRSQSTTKISQSTEIYRSHDSRTQDASRLCFV